jgi:outer membrane phospholipase A
MGHAALKSARLPYKIKHKQSQAGGNMENNENTQEMENTQETENKQEAKQKKSFIAQVVKDAIRAEVKQEFEGKTREEIKAAIAANSAKAQENETLNNESIRLYRERANESRVLREKNRALQSMLSAEKKTETAKETLAALSVDEIKALLAIKLAESK